MASGAPLSRLDEALRGALTAMIAEKGHAPTTAELAARTGQSEIEVEQALLRLHGAHALLLHPDTTQPWAVHPFALSPGGCWVATPELGYWANCLYCAFGIAAALHCDAAITTRIGGEDEQVLYIVRDGQLPESNDVFHFSTPPARWWDNVMHACASFQPFHHEREIDPWCARHGLPRGAVMTIPELWTFASDWYGNCLQQSWRKRSPEDVRALFTRHGLTSEFWKV